MPFDGTSFSRQPTPPQRTPPSDNAISLIILVLAIALLIMPVTLGGFADIIRYIRSE